jgi:beta-glucosidase
VQVYVRRPDSAADRPDKELRDFAKLELEPGQTRTVSFDLPARAFAHWDTQRKAWRVEPGPREIVVGSSSRDLRQSARVDLAGT